MKEKPQKAPECASEAFCGFGIFRTSAKMRNSAEGGWRLLQQQAVSVLAVDGMFSSIPLFLFFFCFLTFSNLFQLLFLASL